MGQKAFNVGLNDYNLHYNESREKGARTLNPQNIGFNAAIIPTYRQKKLPLTESPIHARIYTAIFPRARL